ncbi:hypothetical protein ACQKL6_02655 [Peribacillus sp. NPDC097197]
MKELALSKKKVGTYYLDLDGVNGIASPLSPYDIHQYLFGKNYFFVCILP